MGLDEGVLEELVTRLRCELSGVESIYMIGSRGDGTAVGLSDADVAVLLDRAPLPEDFTTARGIARGLQRGVRVDLMLKERRAVVAGGWQPLKGESRLLWGDDARPHVPDEPLEPYLLRWIHGFVVYGRIVRSTEREVGTYPLEPPDPAGVYRGYERVGLLTDAGWRPGTRTMVNLVTAATTVRLAALAGARASTKQESVERCQQLVADEWAGFAHELYTLCKGELGYRLPGDGQVREREALARLCARLVELENSTLELVADRIAGFPRLVPPAFA